MPAYLEQAVNEAIPQAYGFLTAKYGWKFSDVTLIIQPTACRSRYFDNKTSPKWTGPVATIAGGNGKLYLYEKKSLGKYRDGVNVGHTIDIACGIIHELTHHVQYVEKRGYGELETTANELEFLKVSHPEWYKLIMK